MPLGAWSVKLCYLTVLHPCGAGEQFLEPELEALVRRGHDVTVIPLRPGRTCRSSAARVVSERAWSGACLLALVRTLVTRPLALVSMIAICVRTRPANAVRNLLILPKACWLAAHVRHEEYDHVHVQWATTPATAAMVASHLSGVPWSVTVHRHDALASNLLGTKARRARFIRFASQAAHDDAVRLEPSIPAEKALLAHMGVVVPPAPTREGGTSAGRSVVLCPGMLTARKGQAALVRALAMLSDLAMEVWLAGDGEDRINLERLAKELAVDDRVRFLGLLPHEDLLRLYAEGKVWAVALPTHHEGIPFALMEAMAYGVPVISTPVGGIPELLGGGAGVMVPVDDPSALAAALRALHVDPGEDTRVGRAGRQRIVEDFELEATVSWLEAAIQQ